MHPYLSSDIPGIGGVIKQSPGDFLVEEIPAYEPCGAGEHLYLLVEKRGITTLEAIRRLARRLRVAERDVGYAGMKDAVGVTRQYLSFQRVAPGDAEGVELDGLRVLAVRRHANKLKPGHLKGNRFEIVVRGVAPSAAEIVPLTLAVLKRRGVPNYFGLQRYGSQGNSHLIGAAMMRGEWKAAVDRLIGSPDAVRDDAWRAAISAYHAGDIAAALHLMPGHCQGERDLLQRLKTRPGAYERAFASIHPRLRKLYLSAWQSALFDLVVAHRIARLDEVMAGDLAWKHLNGACFLVEDAALEAPRAAAFEISATGPMFGAKMKQPAGLPLAIEREILENEKIAPDAMDPGTWQGMEGERRPLRVPLIAPAYRLEDNDLLLGFELPRGSYATSVVRELTKSM